MKTDSHFIERVANSAWVRPGRTNADERMHDTTAYRQNGGFRPLLGR